MWPLGWPRSTAWCGLDGGHLFALLLLALGPPGAAELVERAADDAVDRLERSHALGKEVPVLEHGGQNVGLARLERVHGEDERGDENDDERDDDRERRGGEREAHENRRDDKEAQSEVGEGKPAVIGSRVAEELGGVNGDRAERPDDVPDDDARQVEEKVGKGDAQRVLEL